jgi:hypothetical protein
MTLIRVSFTDEDERDKDRQEALIDHTRTRVCSVQHYVSLQEFSRFDKEPEGAEILF